MADLFSHLDDALSDDDTSGNSDSGQTPGSASNGASDDGPRVLSVTELTRGLSSLVEKHYDGVWIEGELSNFKRAASGHCYFTLKDDDAQIRCVMWRHMTKYVYFDPEDGMLVRVRGSASVYERRGDLQILAKAMRQAGKGAQQEAYEQLKQKLKAEGLFERERKKALPPFPESVGVVTSGTGAALHDILSVLERRFPSTRVVVCPVRVQGLQAPDAIAGAVRRFNALADDHPKRPDLLIVGRGGGSAEDLWAFNEEIVARAIAESALPVVSAVGHESDVSIADFVADRRAATPSMAAEIVVPDRRDVAARVRDLHERLQTRVLRRIQTYRQDVDRLVNSRAFLTPVHRLETSRNRLDGLVDRLHRGADRVVERARHRTERLHDRLRAADPNHPLRRGYALISGPDGVVSSAEDVTPGDRVRLRFADGTRNAEITDE